MTISLSPKLPNFIRILSRFLASLAYIAIACQIVGILIISVILYYFSPWEQYNAIVREVPGLPGIEEVPNLLWPVIALTWILFAPNCIVFYHLGRLFWGFSQGEIFTKSSIRRIKWIGYSLGLMGLVVGAGFICISRDILETDPGAFLTPLFIFVTGLVVWVIAFVFEESRKLNEEVSLTI